MVAADHRLSAVDGVHSPLAERGAGTASPEPLPPLPIAPFHQRSAAGRMHHAKQIVKDFGGRSQAAIRN